MGVNLLPQATETDLKKVDSGIKGFMGLILWGGVMIVIFVILFLVRGIETGTEKELLSQKSIAINRLNEISALSDSYYSLAYKTTVLDVVRTQQYKPSVVGDYIDSKLGDSVTINSYNFDSSGSLLIQLDAPNYLTAVRIWNSLLEDKKIITELNLNSFSENPKEEVSFQLKGVLNLDALYELNGE